MGIADSIAEVVKREVGKQTATLVAQRELLLDVFTKATQTMQKAIEYIRGDAPKMAAALVESKIDLPKPTVVETPMVGTRRNAISHTAIRVTEVVTGTGRQMTTGEVQKALGLSGKKGREKAGRWLQYAEHRGMVVRVQQGLYAPPNVKLPEWRSKAIGKPAATRQGLAVARMMYENGLDGHSRDEVRRALVANGYNGTVAAAQTRLWYGKAANVISERSRSIYITEEGLRLLKDEEAAGRRHDATEVRVAPAKRKRAAKEPASTPAAS